MKKLGVILIAAVVVFGCVLAAGCTNTDQPSTTTDPTLTIDVVKTGSTTYNIGDTFTLTFPSNPSTGYDWYPVYYDGLSVKDTYTQAQTDKKIVGAPGTKTFTFTAEEEGYHPIVLSYMRGTDEESTTSVYSDLMYVEKSENDHSEGSFTFTGDMSPVAGSTVLITANGNPTSGYELVPEVTEGLTITKKDYVPGNTGSDGASGTYKWYVTASEPGIYVFTANEVHVSGDSATTQKFTVPLIFTVE